MNDIADRTPLVLAEEQALSLGVEDVRWFSTPIFSAGDDGGAERAATYAILHRFEGSGWS